MTANIHLPSQLRHLLALLEGEKRSRQLDMVSTIYEDYNQKFVVLAKKGAFSSGACIDIDKPMNLIAVLGRIIAETSSPQLDLPFPESCPYDHGHS